jgi:cysteinyl-tRNA synthetase
MSLTFQNTLTGKLEAFAPLDPNKVRLYACGPTVYDYAHVGNARPIVVFDTLYRVLRQVYGVGAVHYTRNITDVDDKIIDRAQENGESIDALTQRTTDNFHADIAALNALAPDDEPRCTAYIPQMVAMIEELIAKGHAYEAEGHALFAIESYADYGRLSKRDMEDMIAGARIEVAPYKRHPGDFVLWKPSREDQPGWPSPWGRGRPGWHIECSAMARETLGASFDIHAGGLDLIFPHHENEIAQSCCANGQEMAHTWLHNGFLTVNGEKMSKSLGNFFTVHELLEEGTPGEAIRLVLLSAHYRAPMDFNKDKIADAKTQLNRMYRALEGFEGQASSAPKVLAALGDDLNSPLALAEMHALVTEINKAEPEEKQALQAQLKGGGDLLGLLQNDPKAWFQGASAGGFSAEEIEAMIQARIDARAAKDFAKADALRDALVADGIELLDRPGGKTEWRRL